MEKTDIAATTHKVLAGNSQSLESIADESVALVVTSPPYPMIGLWDDQFISLNGEIKNYLSGAKGKEAFLAMHEILDPVWLELKRLVRPGGFVCINIGDAARRIGDSFQLYPNHSLIQKRFLELDFAVLPLILWWKPTNAPNKFMGSGMLAAGAYVTLEHEYILIFRKGQKRTFLHPQRLLRRQCALFWEERNKWYADRWDLKGVKQVLAATVARKRSAAFPFELAYRLINMYSLRDDLVLDPFLGTGTTLFAALASARHSIGVEIEKELLSLIKNNTLKLRQKLNDFNAKRLADHRRFASGLGQGAYINTHYGFPVKTRQETDLIIPFITGLESLPPGGFKAYYSAEEIPDQEPRQKVT